MLAMCIQQSLSVTYEALCNWRSARFVRCINAIIVADASSVRY